MRKTTVMEPIGNEKKNPSQVNWQNHASSEEFEVRVITSSNTGFRELDTMNAVLFSYAYRVDKWRNYSNHDGQMICVFPRGEPVNAETNLPWDAKRVFYEAGITSSDTLPVFRSATAWISPVFRKTNFCEQPQTEEIRVTVDCSPHLQQTYFRFEHAL